jgi:hypothetical protein
VASDFIAQLRLPDGFQSVGRRGIAPGTVHAPRGIPHAAQASHCRGVTVALPPFVRGLKNEALAGERRITTVCVSDPGRNKHLHRSNRAGGSLALRQDPKLR